MLKGARETRGSDKVNAERMEAEFGIKKSEMTLNDLNDLQLLQALFIETQWAVAAQGEQLKVLSGFASLNRAQRRKAQHAKRR
jgi:hypothetical protein